MDEFSPLPSPTPVDLPEVEAVMKTAFVFGLMPYLFEPRSKGDGSDKGPWLSSGVLMCANGTLSNYFLPSSYL